MRNAIANENSDSLDSESSELEIAVFKDFNANLRTHVSKSSCQSLIPKSVHSKRYCSQEQEIMLTI